MAAKAAASSSIDTNGQEASKMFQKKFFRASVKNLGVPRIVWGEAIDVTANRSRTTTRRTTKHMARFIAPTRAGATPRNVFGAAPARGSVLSAYCRGCVEACMWLCARWLGLAVC